MNKKELLEKKIEILRKILDNKNNIQQVLEEEQKNNKEIEDKTIKDLKEKSKNENNRIF